MTELFTSCSFSALARMSSRVINAFLWVSSLNICQQCCRAAVTGWVGCVEILRFSCTFSWFMLLIYLQRAFSSSALAFTCFQRVMMYSFSSPFSFTSSYMLVILLLSILTCYLQIDQKRQINLLLCMLLPMVSPFLPSHNNRMNLFKSAFSSSKTDPLQRSLDQLYEDVKSWDQSRARSLQNHLRIVEVVMEALDGKVGQVERYIAGLQLLMGARIDEITTYCRNGVNDSQFFLVPCTLASMKPSHQLLKHLLMEQSQRELTLSKKGAVLSEILQRLKQLKADECSGGEGEGSTVSELKSNIRFLIDCELADVNGQVLATCRQVSGAQKEGKDFYLAIEKFARNAMNQLKMHHEIGKELLHLVDVFSKREKELRVQLREILSRWVREDLQDKIFEEQLHKNKTDELIDDYYDIENIAPEHSALWGGASLSDYLKNFQILPFSLHEKLVVYSRLLLYNGKVEAKMVLTEQKFAHLFRLSAIVPDFSFTLGKHIRIKVKSPLNVGVLQWKRTLMLREEVQFQFLLEFNLESDQREFLEKAKGLGCQFEDK